MLVFSQQEDEIHNTSNVTKTGHVTVKNNWRESDVIVETNKKAEFLFILKIQKFDYVVYIFGVFLLLNKNVFSCEYCQF